LWSGRIRPALGSRELAQRQGCGLRRRAADPQAEWGHQIQTDQRKAALRSLFELADVSGDAIDLFFGPTAPHGHEDRWIQTTPGKSWFAYFRIYGPQNGAFNGDWRPGDFTRT
jgi:hypothetical protein